MKSVKTYLHSHAHALFRHPQDSRVSMVEQDGHSLTSLTSPTIVPLSGTENWIAEADSARNATRGAWNLSGHWCRRSQERIVPAVRVSSWR